MNINIKTTNMELTGAIRDYVDKRLESLGRFIEEVDNVVYVEIGKTTNHHKQGDFYKAEINLKINNNNFFTVSEKGDLYEAIDDAKEEMFRRITAKKDRSQTLFRRGAKSVKKMLKGLSDRNPFTSK